MSTIGGVGQGFTLALSTDSSISRARNVQLPEWISERVDFTGLNNITWMVFLPGAPADPGQFTAEAFFNSEIARPTIRAVQDATLTFPIQTSGNTTNATLVGSGFITRIGLPNVRVGEPLIETLVFAFDGNVTVPAFTAESV